MGRAVDVADIDCLEGMGEEDMVDAVGRDPDSFVVVTLLALRRSVTASDFNF